MRNEKGLTLIELIVTMAIAFILLGISFSVLNIGVKSQERAIENYDIQADIRYAIEIINNTIRYSSVTFAVTSNEFSPVIDDGDISGLAKPWSYIGLSPDGNSITHYKFIDDGLQGYYKAETLVDSSDDLTFKIQFNKEDNTNENKILRYILEGYRNDNRLFNQTTEVNALNSIQVIDWGDLENPAIAMAYRTEETPEIDERAVGAMAMVIDTSGSMAWGLNGKDTTTTDIDGSNPVRLTLLKDTLTNNNTGILSILEEAETFLSLVDFDTNANYSTNQDFYHVSNEKEELTDIIDNLYANGGTNTGDGLRRAYYQLNEFNNNKENYGLESDQETKNYMVILVDGVTTFASAEIIVRDYQIDNRWEGRYIDYVNLDDNVGNTYYTTNQNLSGNKLVDGDFSGDSLLRPIGDGINLDTDYGEPYIDEIGEMINESGLIDQVFVIGYSNDNVNGEYPELESVAHIGEALGLSVNSNDVSEMFINNDYIFVANDRDSLNDAFKKIGNYFIDELWQVEGPSLD